MLSWFGRCLLYVFVLGKYLTNINCIHIHDRMHLLNRHQEEMKAARERYEAQAEQLQQQVAELQVKTVLSVCACGCLGVCLFLFAWVGGLVHMTMQSCLQK